MKKINLCLLFFIVVTAASAQYWNPSGSTIYYNAGNVGIGEANPQARLSVLESGGLGTSQGSFKLLTRFAMIGNVNHFMISDWLYRDANGSDWFTARAHNGISVDASFLTPGVNTRTWWERDPYNNIQSWGDIGQTYMTINQGNVGIGTTSPSIWFGTKTFEFSDARPVFKLTSTANPGLSTIVFTNSNVNASTHLGEFHINHQFDQANNDKSLLRFGSYPGSDVLVLQSNGNVGIGTTNPTQKLTVKGTVYSTEVKVDLNVPGPDYVFEPAYHLQPLSEIETYIKAYKHLPEVPSAKEMEANGINLSEMNMLLLKKVEKLTLHVIELKKENEKQNDIIKYLLKKQE